MRVFATRLEELLSQTNTFPDNTLANLQLVLGDALSLVGAQTCDPEPLQKAVDLYRVILETWTVDRMPAAWAWVQCNLGGAMVPDDLLETLGFGPLRHVRGTVGRQYLTHCPARVL